MEGFLARRAADTRFTNERRVTGTVGSTTTMSTAWYQGANRVQTERYTFSASEYKSGDSNHKMTPHRTDSPKKSRKLKRKKGSEEFTEAQKKELRDRESSDNSDSGGCWSGYESVEGKKKGEKGSCKKR